VKIVIVVCMMVLFGAGCRPDCKYLCRPNPVLKYENGNCYCLVAGVSATPDAGLAGK
jgi:hypothetical protein